MDVNGVTSSSAAYTSYSDSTKTTQSEKVQPQTDSTATSSGVVYEPSGESKASAVSNNQAANPALIEKLKADAEARTAQMRQLVEQLITKQGNAFGKSTDDAMWKFLASGDFTVDAATKAQAQADIAEDGYWGVKQTSDRILDFAKALAGDDPDKMNKMLDAFKKGFEQATKTWGKELPEISQKTYDAVLQKFEDWQNEHAAASQA